MIQQRITHILLALTALLMLSTPLTLNAKDEDDIYEMSLDENLETPEIRNDKQAAKIQEFQYDIAVAFSLSNYDVEVMRDGEVIVITIPASQLFGPNDTVVTKVGQELLKYLVNQNKKCNFAAFFRNMNV